MSETKDPNPRPAAQEEEASTEMDRRLLLRGSLAGLTALGIGSAGGTALAATGSEPLVLKHDNLRGSVAALFGELNDNGGLRKIFVKDPSKVVLSAILPKGMEMPTKQRLSEANRFLFSLLANPDFRQWAEDYQAKLNAGLRDGRFKVEDVDKLSVAQDMAAAFGKYGDTSLMVSLANQAALPDKALRRIDVEVTVEVYIAVVAVIFLIIFAIDITPVTSDEYFDKRLSPAEIRSIADQLVNQARMKQQSGRLADAKATH